MKSKILVADDHGIVRQGVRSLLERQLDVEFTADAEDGVELLPLIREFKPDVVIIDFAIPNLNEIGGVRQVLKRFPDIKVVVLSERLLGGFVRGMFEAGICGYILKDNLFEELVGAIKKVLEGGIYLSPAIVGVEVDDYVKHLAEDSKV